jgi:predicted ATPase/DNA-binding SARP family transcriptional activator/tetratricopeptide (TPR) repeat protein
LDHLEIRTFGGLKIHLNQKPLDGLKTRKVEALLVFIAMRGQRTERSLLADLFWQEFPADKALTNLRVAISNLRKKLHPFLSITRYQIGLNPDADIWLDTTEFKKSLSRGYIDAALDLYQGDFLDGFHIRDAPGFEEWYTTTREQLHLLIQENVHDLIRDELIHGTYTSGLLHARRLLELDPLDEFAHRYAMQFHAARGQRGKAIRQYQTCKRILSDELGVDPDPETTRFYDTIRAGEPTPALKDSLNKPEAGKSAHRSFLPADITPFVGREKEVEQITKLISDSRTRLITILGSGGIGKTRLSLAASRSLQDHFADGIFFVSLVSIREPDEIPSKIADILGIQLQAGVMADQQLFNYLHPRQLLLVLDNFEHLLSGVGLIRDLLQAAPRVKVLATSREKLEIPGETIFYLRGMHYPENVESANIQSFGSIQLFSQSARRADPAFEIEELNIQAIIDICRLVEGMPLGIELAAAWVELLPVHVIVEEVQKSLGFLAANSDIEVDRHNSIRAVFESSWSRLAPAEQQVFARLSVFRGGFTTHAASEITGVSLRQLLSLVNKSFLYPPKGGRYHIHELLRQYGTEKLAENPENEEHSRGLHSAYFTDLIHRQEDEIDRGNLDTVLVEMDNVRASWHFAVLETQYANIQKMISGFSTLLEYKGWYHEGVSAFSWAEKQIQGEEPTLESRLAYGTTLLYYGYFLFRTGDRDRGGQLVQASYELLCQVDAKEEAAWARIWIVDFTSPSDKGTAEKMLRESLATFESLDRPAAKSFTQLQLGDHALYWGDYDKAQILYQETYREYLKLQHDAGAALALLGLGNVADFQGDYLSAQQKYVESKLLFEEIGFVTMVGVLNKYLGNVHLVQNAYQQADEYFRKYLALNQEIGINWRVADAQHSLARVAIARADLDSAHRYLDQALAGAQAFGDTISLGFCYCHLGHLSFLEGDDQMAGERFLDALQVSRAEIYTTEISLLVMAQAAPLIAKSGEPTLAVEMASVAAHDPRKLQPFIQHEARKTIGSLKTLLPETEFTAAMDRGRERKYDSVRFELIERLKHLI